MTEQCSAGHGVCGYFDWESGCDIHRTYRQHLTCGTEITDPPSKCVEEKIIYSTCGHGRKVSTREEDYNSELRSSWSQHHRDDGSICKPPLDPAQETIENPGKMVKIRCTHCGMDHGLPEQIRTLQEENKSLAKQLAAMKEWAIPTMGIPIVSPQFYWECRLCMRGGSKGKASIKHLDDCPRSSLPESDRASK